MRIPSDTLEFQPVRFTDHSGRNGSYPSDESLGYVPSSEIAGDDVLRVSTNFVTAPVVIETRQGAHVTDLKLEDFHVYEDGVEQQISHFETLNKLPRTS